MRGCRTAEPCRFSCRCTSASRSPAAGAQTVQSLRRYLRLRLTCLGSSGTSRSPGSSLTPEAPPSSLQVCSGGIAAHRERRTRHSSVRTVACEWHAHSCLDTWSAFRRRHTCRRRSLLPWLTDLPRIWSQAAPSFLIREPVVLLLTALPRCNLSKHGSVPGIGMHAKPSLHVMA